MKQRGFTLLEVMVALGILAFVVISTHQILDSTTKAKDASDEKIAELNGLQTTFRLTTTDDDVYEGDETFTVAVQGATGAATIANREHHASTESVVSIAFIVLY